MKTDINTIWNEAGRKMLIKNMKLTPTDITNITHTLKEETAKHADNPLHDVVYQLENTRRYYYIRTEEGHARHGTGSYIPLDGDINKLIALGDKELDDQMQRASRREYAYCDNICNIIKQVKMPIEVLCNWLDEKHILRDEPPYKGENPEYYKRNPRTHQHKLLQTIEFCVTHYNVYDIVKLYTDNGGYAGMTLSEWLRAITGGR